MQHVIRNADESVLDKILGADSNLGLDYHRRNRAVGFIVKDENENPSVCTMVIDIVRARNPELRTGHVLDRRTTEKWLPTFPHRLGESENRSCCGTSN